MSACCRDGLVQAFPASHAAIELHPCRLVEARVGEFADAECASRCAELEVTGRLTLVSGAVRVAGLERGVKKVAGRIAVALASNIERYAIVLIQFNVDRKAEIAKHYNHIIATHT